LIRRNRKPKHCDFPTVAACTSKSHPVAVNGGASSTDSPARSAGFPSAFIRTLPWPPAREKREEARRQVAAGIDPGEQRKAAKVALVESTENTFETIAREWFGLFSTRWVSGHANKIIRRLELNVFPWLGTLPIKAIAAPELLAVMRRVEARGAPLP
jgi:hypothetical protein